MSDWYRDMTNSAVLGGLTRRLGLPRPAVLRRHTPGDPLLTGPALVVAAGTGPLVAAVSDLLRADGAEVRFEADGERLAAVVLDATGAETPAELEEVRTALGPALRRLAPSGRVVILGRPPVEADGPTAAATRQALVGIARSVAKEARGGATANLIQVSDGAEDALASTLRFFLSGRSAYVSGQVVRVSPAEVPDAADPTTPHAGRVAVVTGAARGIGASIAETLARDGATVICVDIPAQGQALSTVANRIGGTALQLDITAADAPARLAEHVVERHGGADVIVHNAGITRDKLLANMDEARWASVIAVNLEAQLRINAALLETAGALKENARIVCVSSMSGIAGNRGQVNYAASKAGVIGLVEATAPLLRERGATINAVAPGFIETEMTAAMPFGTREVGRRINSLSQGGLPVDVAETIGWLAQTASAGVTGQTVRVCGQSLLGA
ncbi:MAG: 3-oxoacyl-[acyl-carrier protein] reductase [Actinomycetota bacterium]|nr:3-oxoacyl-[acyl-carrier protein] reductase [Actinomycetota bacterium]